MKRDGQWGNSYSSCGSNSVRFQRLSEADTQPDIWPQVWYWGQARHSSHRLLSASLTMLEFLALDQAIEDIIPVHRVSGGWTRSPVLPMASVQVELQPLNAFSSPAPGELRSHRGQTLWTTEGKECLKHRCLDFMDVHPIKREKLTKNMHLYSNKVIFEPEVSSYIRQKQSWKCQLFDCKTNQ